MVENRTEMIEKVPIETTAFPKCGSEGIKTDLVTPIELSQTSYEKRAH